MLQVPVKVQESAVTPRPDKLNDWRSLQIALARYAFCADFVEDKSVLDIACGGGYGSYFLHQKGARMVLGGDIWPGTLKYASRHYGGAEVHFTCIDACYLPFREASFDVVASFETIRYIPEPIRFLQECSRVLKPEGLFICSTPNRETTSKASQADLTNWGGKEFNETEFYQLIKNCYPDVQVFHFNPSVPHNSLLSRFLSWGARATIKLKPIPGFLPTINFVAGLFSSRYRMVFLKDVADWRQMLDPDLKPYHLQDGTKPGTCLVGVGTNDKTNG